MRGSPMDAAREQRPVSATPPKPRPATSQPQPASAPSSKLSSKPKPKILMGEVAAPRGLEIGKQREAFRAFMIARHLRPTDWARAAGVPAGEIMGFLTGKVRTVPPRTIEKLAAAAKVTPQEMLGLT